ncbi:uncharacterized protein [Panulirus ornatus]|uniref:uncharacterized protein n=1 Tax=Panulirus ornatus TaxID=150431 RepID=UPI003A880532
MEDGRSGAVNKRPSVLGARASRRSHSLLPESAAEVRMARYNLARRRRGFTSVVLAEVQGQAGQDLAGHDLAVTFGHEPPATTATILPRRRTSSAHKLLTASNSYPLTVLDNQCVSCSGEPEHCLRALGLEDACATYSDPILNSTPRRTHSLLRYPRSFAMSALRRPSKTLTARHKPKLIAEESNEGGCEEGDTLGAGACTPDNGAFTPDSDVYTPDSETHTPDSDAHTTSCEKEDQGHETLVKLGFKTPRTIKKLFATRSVPTDETEDFKNSAGTPKAAEDRMTETRNMDDESNIEKIVTPMRRMSI